MFPILTQWLSYYLSGLKHCLRAGNGLTPLAVLYFSLSMLLAILAALSSAWWQATTAHLNKHGFNRLTIEATDVSGLTNQVLRSVQEKFPAQSGFRVVPQYTTIIYMMAADGTYKPFLATSTVTDDPLLMEAPQIQGSSSQRTNIQTPLVNQIHDGRSVVSTEPGLILSPDIVRRLGFANQSQIPEAINIRATRAGHPQEQWNVSLPIAGMVGDLGKLGVRVPYDTMLSLRRFQYFGSAGVEQSVAHASTHSRSNMKNFGELEINAICLQIPAEVSFESVIARVKQIDPTFQLSSPWFEQGKQRSLLSTALRLAGPLLTILIGSNAIVLFVLVYQKVASDTLQLAMMKLSGASSTSILAWYALPLTTLAALTTACGIILAKVFVASQLLPVLESSTQQPLAVRVSYMSLWMMFLIMTTFVHCSLTQRQTRSATLESALG